MVVSGDEWKLLCMVRSYHVYKHVWDLYLDDNFTMEHQRRIPTTNIQLPSYVPVLTNDLPCPALQLPYSWDYDFAPQYTDTKWTLNSWAPHHWQGLVQVLPGYSCQAVSGCHLPVYRRFLGPPHTSLTSSHVLSF